MWVSVLHRVTIIAVFIFFILHDRMKINGFYRFMVQKVHNCRFPPNENWIEKYDNCMVSANRRLFSMRLFKTQDCLIRNSPYLDSQAHAFGRSKEFRISQTKSVTSLKVLNDDSGAISNAMDNANPVSMENSHQEYQVASFFRFMQYKQNDIEEIMQETSARLHENGVTGTVILSEEGYNGQISLPNDHSSRFKVLDILRQSLRDTTLDFNIGRPYHCEIPPFRKLLVKRKTSLTADVPTKNRSTIIQFEDQSFDINPIEWQSKLLSNDRSRIILDIRNHYESSVGGFSGSTPLNTSTYAETWDRLDSILQNTSLDEEIFAYCTGGIRCVKVARYLQNKGYKNVYTLKNGIIGYENWIDQSNSTSLFYGENYLFDRRRMSELNRTNSSSVD